jgi:ribosomal protein S18 acetylase RimI-like enzyme
MNKENLESCLFYRYSESEGILKKKTNEYFSNLLGYPDNNSHFAKSIGNFKYAFRIPIVKNIITEKALNILNKKGYDSLIVSLDEKIIGHNAYQIHKDNSLHIFSLSVNPQYQRNGLAKQMVIHTIRKAKEKKIERVRVGGGKNNIVNKIYSYLADNCEYYNVMPIRGNWLQIKY